MSEGLPRSLKKWAHVSVVWEDAYGSSGAHNSVDFVMNYKPAIRKTSGYVIGYSRTNGYIFLAGTDDRNSNIEDADCEDINVIPLSYVKEIRRI